MTDSILAVRGLDRTTDRFRHALFDMAKRNGWDVDAIAAVMSNESGFIAAAKNPMATASGIIQMIDSTAKRVGIKGGAAELRTLSAEEQIPYVETFYKMTLGKRSGIRPVDYYLAGWGSGIGQPAGFVLARQSDAKTYNDGKKNLYDLNYGLDRNKDGIITVEDLASLVASIQAAAKGVRIPLVTAGSLPESGQPSSEPGQPSGQGHSESPVPIFDASRFPKIDSGIFSHYPGGGPDNGMLNAVLAYQKRHGLKEDGIIWKETWTSFLKN